MSDLALDAWTMRVLGKSPAEIARFLNLEGTSRQAIHNKARRLIEQAVRAGLPDPKKAAIYRNQVLQQDNLRRIRAMEPENISAEATAREFTKRGLTRGFLVEVIQKMKEIENRPHE